jgi:aminopeptidase N
LRIARDVAELWVPASEVEPALARVAEQAALLVGDAELRLPALQVLAACASTPEHDALLDRAARDDVDLAWRMAVRRAELGREVSEKVRKLLERDPDPDAAARALMVTAARPEESAKAEVWRELFERRTVPAGMVTYQVAKAFWRPTQADLLLPWARRYLAEVASLRGGMLSILSLVRAMQPTVGDEAFLEESAELANRPGLDPTVRGLLLTGTDTLDRMLRARAVGEEG